MVSLGPISAPKQQPDNGVTFFLEIRAYFTYLARPRKEHLSSATPDLCSSQWWVTQTSDVLASFLGLPTFPHHWQTAGQFFIILVGIWTSPYFVLTL